MKLKVKSNSTLTDFVTKKQRLTKKQPQADFRLADNDDFFGFNSNTLKLSTTEKVTYAIIIGFFAWFVLQALQFIF
jgi:hypothetical protein